jgi:hypothetical protein
LSDLRGLAFDSAGNLYASNANFGSNGSIVKFTPGGVRTVFVGSGLSGPEFLAFTDNAGVPLPLPIPEPASLGLLLPGVAAGAGLLLHRQRRSPKWTPDIQDEV